jgi:hypothetical protein
MYTHPTYLPVKGQIHEHLSARVERLFTWLAALLVAGMTFPFWKSLVLLIFEKLYEILIMQHY